MDQSAVPDESAEPSSRSADSSSRRRRTILIIQATLITLALVSTIAAFVARSGNDENPPESAASAGVSSSDDPSPAASPTGAEPTATSSLRPGGIPTTAAPPVQFGAITVTDEVLHVAPITPVASEIVVHYPSVSGLSDASRQAQVNAFLRDRAGKTVAGFTGDFGGYPAGSGDNGFALVSSQPQVAGKLISIRSDTQFRFPGAQSINQGMAAFTVRLDTAETIAIPAMFTPRGVSNMGVQALAFGLASLPGVARCNNDPDYGRQPIIKALTSLVSGQDGAGATVSVTTDSLRFTFGAGVIGPRACGVIVGLSTFSSLTTLVDPGLVALATASP